MGSTITVGKQAGAFQVDGVTYYALFERTYESNVFPQTPRWSPHYFGRLEGAIKSIFLNASATEGGMLRGPSVRMKPENYIAAWLRELKSPKLIADRSITIYPRDIPNDVSRQAVQRLFGISNEFVQPLTVQLYKDASKLADAGEVFRIPPWRILDWEMVSATDAAAGYAPARADATQIAATVESEKRKFYRVGRNDVLMEHEDEIKAVGWAHDAIGRFVSACAQRELQMPGFAVKAIPAYRACVDAATPLPDDTIVRFPTLTPSAEDWKIKTHAERATELRKELGLAPDNEIKFDLNHPLALDLLTYYSAPTFEFEKPAPALEAAPLGM